MFLDDVVAGACRYVITIGPNGGPRIIRKERPQKLVTIVFAERIFPRAHGIANRERPLALCCRRRAIRIYSGIGNRRRNKLERQTRLVGPSRRTQLRRITRLPNRWLIGSDWATRKDRHYYQPTTSQLIVANDCIAIVARFALASKSCKHCVGYHRAIQDLPR